MKLKLAATTLILVGSITITGCITNSGDDGDNSRSGNNSYYTQAVKLNIANTEQIAFTKVIITDKQNKEILNQVFNCVPGATCPINFNEQLQTPVTLKFYNQNKLITTYTIVDLADNFGKIETSDVMLGTYIYKQLKAKDKVLATTLSSKLDMFFDCYCSPDKRPDNFEELGLYYKAMVVQGKETDQQFYKRLIAELNAGKKLPGGSLSKKAQQLTKLKSATVKNDQVQVKSAKSPSCSEYTSDIMTGFSALKMFPIPGLGGPFDFVDRIVKGACSNFEGNVLNGLDEIKNKLNEMDAKLDALGFRLQELADKMDQQNLGNNISQFNNQLTDWSVWRNTYYQILAGGSYKDFGEYLRKNGNLAGIRKIGGDGAKFLGNLKTLDSLYIQLNETQRLNSIKQSLKSLCNDSGKIHEDIITRRLQCNIITSEMVAKLTTTAQEEKLILNDVSNAIMKDPGYKDILKDSWVLPPIATSWEKVDAALTEQQLAKLKQVKTVFASDGIPFDPYEGLSKELQKNIATVGCNYNNTDVPYITSWKIAADSSEKWKTYISVVCKNKNRTEEKEVHSYYNYLQENDDNVRNVLGVLVSDHYVNEAQDKSINDNDDRYYTLMETKDDQFEMGIYLDGGDGKLLSFNSDTYSNFNNRIINSSLYNNPLRWLDDKGMLFSKITFPEREWPNKVSNDYIVPMSYVYKGITYVYALKIRAITTSNSTSPRTAKVGLLCLTSDCQRSGSWRTEYSQLKFNSGLNIRLDGGGKNKDSEQYLHIW